MGALRGAPWGWVLLGTVGASWSEKGSLPATCPGVLWEPNCFGYETWTHGFLTSPPQ